MTTQSEYADENNKLITALSPRWMHSPKRIRVIFGGVAVADSTNAHLLREGGPPVYYFPEADARTDLLTPTSTVKNSPVRGDASYSSLTLNGRTADDAVWTFKEPAETASFLKGYLAFDWPKMDAWFEEREEVFVHARDPFKRIDTVKTDRKIHVVVGGETVAETTRYAITCPWPTSASIFSRQARLRVDAPTRALPTTIRSWSTVKRWKTQRGCTVTPPLKCRRSLGCSASSTSASMPST
jgi:uncharacterized protein (DUF427 family)